MKKHFRVSTALLAAVLLAGCGSISSKDGGYYATESPSAEGAYDTAAGAANSSIVPEELPDSTDETAQKIIYNADINMESTDFDAARDTLLAAVDDCGAWMEYSSLSGDAKDHDRYAYYTVRVPVENYRTFLAAVGEAGSVLDLSETAENITSSYIDVQARLSALEAQRERLNALADQAETTADLLEIESQLSDVQYQLENYTRQLKNMDQQVSYSTVDIRLSEVATLTPTGCNGTNGELISWQAGSDKGAALGAVLYGGSFVGGVAGYNDATATITKQPSHHPQRHRHHRGHRRLRGRRHRPERRGQPAHRAGQRQPHRGRPLCGRRHRRQPARERIQICQRWRRGGQRRHHRHRTHRGRRRGGHYFFRYNRVVNADTLKNALQNKNGTIAADLLTCLSLAAKRGVDVRIYTPGVPDKKTIYQLSRSYFPHLLKAGVKIYSYTPGFLHAKTWLIDDRAAAVGTVNLDYRSLYLHFENSTVLYGGEVLSDIRRDLDGIESVSRRLGPDDCRNGFLGSMLSACLRLVAPLC